jgi:hypothetical protein
MGGPIDSTSYTFVFLYKMLKKVHFSAPMYVRTHYRVHLPAMCDIELKTEIFCYRYRADKVLMGGKVSKHQGNRGLRGGREEGMFL